MNLADDFFKAKRQADKLSAELEKKERELYSVRHDLIEVQLTKENLDKELEEFKAKNAELEAELEKLKSEKKQAAAASRMNNRSTNR